jgi:hypothetical protein
LAISAQKPAVAAFLPEYLDEPKWFRFSRNTYQYTVFRTGEGIGVPVSEPVQSHVIQISGGAFIPPVCSPDHSGVETGAAKLTAGLRRRNSHNG